MYPCEEKPEYKLVFSTKRSSTTILHRSVLNSINDSTSSKENLDTLKNLGILVSDTNEEKKEMLGIIDKINENKTVFNAVAIMNLDCNLACRYCFEGTMKGKMYMDNETADRFIDLNQSYIENGKNVQVTFYGGEPLLSIDLIK